MNNRFLWLAVLGSALLVTGCVTIAPFGHGDHSLHQTTISGQGNAEILWLPISGFISSRPSKHAFGLIEQPSTLTRVRQALNKAKTDTHIKALVLRIDSPGGMVSASDEIYSAIKRYHRETGVPVIASLGGIAASGAYYVAMAAGRVIAEPTTITGSIGVVIFDVNAAGLLHKLGIRNETITSGPHKDGLSPLRRPSASERAIVQKVVNALFAHFVAVVKANRPHLDRSRINMITDGRIFAARQAKRLGLVDAIGHMPAVLAGARQAAGVTQARVIRYYRGQQAPKTLTAEAAARPADSARAWLQALSRLDTPGAGQPLYLWRGTAPR